MAKPCMIPTDKVYTNTDDALRKQWAVQTLHIYSMRNSLFPPPRFSRPDESCGLFCPGPDVLRWGDWLERCSVGCRLAPHVVLMWRLQEELASDVIASWRLSQERWLVVCWGGRKAVCGAMISDILCSQHGERRPWARSQCIPLSVQQCPIVSSFFRCLQAKDFIKLLEGNVFTLPEKQNKHDLGNALRSWPSINNSAVSPH